MHSDPILRRIHACRLAKVPCLLTGKPGVGKTARVLAYGAAVQAHVERWIGSRCEAIDIKPRTVDAAGEVHVRMPPEIARLHAHGGGILFADELNRAERATEGAMLDVFDHPPPGCFVIAAVNPLTRGQSSRNLESATANRFCHLVVGSDQKAWADAQITGWNVTSDGFPSVSDESMDRWNARARALSSGFIRAAGTIKIDGKDESLFDAEPSDPARAGGAWPSPRSWESAAKLHGAAMALGLDTTDILALVGGCVGDGAAVMYLTYVQTADLPDPDVLLENPALFVPDPARIDRTIVVLTAVAGAIRQSATEERWEAAWKIVNRCVDADQIDAGMVGSELLASWHDRSSSNLKKPAFLLHKKVVKLIVTK